MSAAQQTPESPNSAAQHPLREAPARRPLKRPGSALLLPAWIVCPIFIISAILSFLEDNLAAGLNGLALAWFIWAYEDLWKQHTPNVSS